ncbi:MAG: hypothetical protein KDC61_02350 [Saprospiraceae bacterium]|nr:hypothetical protein [Saprospiraceae bacterium]
MARKDRTALKALFANGSIPTAKNFGDLIDSALIKRDDQFHGYWRSGTAYRLGDVVIWCKSMFMLFHIDSGDTHCSTDEPQNDKSHWSQLQFDLEDKDWVIPESDAADYIFAHPERAKKVGIGQNKKEKTDTGELKDPLEAQLHIFEKERGEFKFNPDGGQGVEMRMEAFDYPDCNDEPFLSLTLDDCYAHTHTNTALGFKFEHTNPDQAAQDAPTPLMVVSVHEDESGEKKQDKPKVGIGTPGGSAAPDATLQVRDDWKGDLKVFPTESVVPEVVLTNTIAGQNNACLAVSVDANFADLATNAANGFRFKQKNDAVAVAQQNVKSGKNAKSAPVTNDQVVVVDERSQVGVGIEQPEAKLHVTDQSSGAFQVRFDHMNPAVAILNLEENADENTAFVLGADSRSAILMSDAPCGFVFKKSSTPLYDVYQGEDQVWIDQDGRVGVGKAPEEHELDVQGSVRAFENYLAVTQANYDELGVMDAEKALDIICNLNPIRFKWTAPEGSVRNDTEHFGLRDNECERYAKEVVKKDENQKILGVSYVELIPVLIAAMKQQQEMIDALRRRVQELERR